MELGQVQIWLNCWFVVACYCWLTNKRVAAGMLVGAVCLFKPQFGLFLIWGLLRREWKFIAGWAIVVLPGEFLSLVMYGFRNGLDYMSVLSFLSRHGEVYAANQSVNGLLNRFVGDGSGVVDWDGDGFPDYNLYVYLGTVVSSFALVGWTIMSGRTRSNVTIFDFLIAGLAFTMASPVAWEHHYGFLPAVIIVLTIAILATRPIRTHALWLLFVAALFFFSGSYIPRELLPRQGFGSLLQSYVLLAALMQLGLLAGLRAKFEQVSQTACQRENRAPGLELSSDIEVA
jgi:alpha-1,2-mannosyltransferase